MADILISEEEKARFFMGEDAFERADLERQIQELQRQLDHKDRLVEATIRKVKDDCAKEIAKFKTDRKEAIDQLGKIYEDFSDPKKLKKQDKNGEIRRLQTALLNAKMMINVLSQHTIGGHSVEANNLVCAIKSWANLAVDVDMDALDKSRLRENLRQVMYNHLKAIFEPDSTVTAKWNKDADPGEHPFGVFVGKTMEDAPDEDTPNEDTTDDDTSNDDTTIVYTSRGDVSVMRLKLFDRFRELRKEPEFVWLREALRKGAKNDG